MPVTVRKGSLRYAALSKRTDLIDLIRDYHEQNGQPRLPGYLRGLSRIDPDTAVARDLTKLAQDLEAGGLSILEKLY